MSMPAHEIIQLVQAQLPDAVIDLVDLAGDQDHYQMRITSASFIGKTKIQQHQLVYKALGALMGTQLHALSLLTFEPTPNL
jgi:stress-induced morphogen